MKTIWSGIKIASPILVVLLIGLIGSQMRSEPPPKHTNPQLETICLNGVEYYYLYDTYGTMNRASSNLAPKLDRSGSVVICGTEDASQ